MRPLPEEFFTNSDTPALRRVALRCLQDALAAADASAAVQATIWRRDAALHVADAVYALDDIEAVYVLGGGKAAAPMAAALEPTLGERLRAGIVAVKYGHTVPTRRVRLVEAAHPLPDAAGVAAAAEVIQLAIQAGPRDLVFVLLSGGGSALLTAPAPGVTLEDKLAVTDLLLRAGAPIGELNTVRKHLSHIKGGWLARHISPARTMTLVLSDVLGNRLDAIASGPTVPDPTTFQDAVEILHRREIHKRAPASVRAHLEAGARRQVPETPKPGDPVFASTQTVIVADLARVVAAAADAAKGLGFRPVVLSSAVEGEAREVGAELGRRARAAGEGAHGPLPVCLLQGGETTVTVRGSGKGGRNQEVALGAALEIAGLPETLVLSGGTDGTDGPTDAAGAVADGTTVERARVRGLDPQDALARNDAYHFFAALGDLIITGPTLTNVNDLMLAFVAPAAASRRPG